MADADVTDSGISGGKDTNGEEIEENGDRRPQKKLAKKMVVKVVSKSKKQPKTQTAAMWQMVQCIEQCSSKQEKTVILGWPPCSSQRGKGPSYF